MKFLIATNHSYMLWQFRKEFIKKLLECGEVVLSMPFVGHEDDFAKMGCKCIETTINRRGLNPFNDLKLYSFYKKVLNNEQPDTVITYSIKPNVYMGYACRRKKIPYYVNVQGLGTAFQKEPIASIATFMYKVGTKKAEIIFFENSVNADEFLKRKIVPVEKQVVLNGAGVNLDEYVYQDYKSEENGIRFLFLGRIMKEKGVDELFESAKCLKNKYGDKIVFDLVGPFEDEYKDVVDKLVDDGIVNYYGFQTDPKSFYANSHCVVLPSYHEGMSNVLLEAASTGRALIASNISGCKEVVEDGVTGYLCEKKDVSSLMASMEKFLSLRKEERKQMGVMGRRKVQNEFDKNIIVGETIKYFIGH